MTAARAEAPHTRAHRMLKESGYRDGGGIKDKEQDAEMVTDGVHEHESHLHKGEPKTKLRLKRNRGGLVEGEEPAARPDKRARGGRMKGPKIGAVNVNVHHSDPAAEQVARQQGAQQGMKMGAQMGARQAMARMAQAPHPMAGGPPMAPPGAGAPPPGGPPPGGAMPPRPMPGAPPQMAADGGEIKVKAHKRRKAGGAVEKC